MSQSIRYFVETEWSDNPTQKGSNTKKSPYTAREFYQAKNYGHAKQVSRKKLDFTEKQPEKKSFLIKRSNSMTKSIVDAEVRTIEGRKADRNEAKPFYNMKELKMRS